MARDPTERVSEPGPPDPVTDQPWRSRDFRLQQKGGIIFTRKEGFARDPMERVSEPGPPDPVTDQP